MSSGQRFSILLVIDRAQELGTVVNMIKRHFPRFYTARTEEQALKLIVEHQIDVLMISQESIQQSEVFYLHLLSAKQNIDKILFRKIVFCDREELKKAFSICNKDVFDDYFITNPLYDPYHLLLRLRFIRRIRHDSHHNATDMLSVESLCEYFDQIIQCDQELSDLNQDSYSRLNELIAFSMAQMKEKILGNAGVMHDARPGIGNLIDQHTEQHLAEVRAQQQMHQQQLHNQMAHITDPAQAKKEKLQGDDHSSQVANSNILLLEEDPETRDKLKAILDAGGYKAVVSGCAKRSLILLKDWKPDVVLLDMSLPDRGSLFVLDQIKQDPQMQHTRIMVLSKPGDTQAAQEAMQLGVHEVMLKPIDHDMLLFKMGHNLQALQKERGH